MCGIAGFTCPTLTQDPALTVLEDMCATLHPRGPDSRGAVFLGGVALGMRRLSIVDLEGGDQPLFNEDGSIALVCNGEIYNSPALRRDLQQRGHAFHTGSDCETLIHAYEEWGVDFLRRVNGMFACALWDNAARKLLLARDRSGIKPLHYAELPGGGLAFASEIKALLAHPQVSRELSPSALLDYLVFEYVPSPASMFAQVRKIPAGHYLLLEEGRGPELRCYWDIELGNLANPGSEEHAVAGVRNAIEKAVRSELMADVPVGVLLSGGLDSSTVAALAARSSTSQVKSFSIAFEDASFDESRYSRMMAAHAGTDHYEKTLRAEDLWKLLPDVFDFLDEPMADSSLIPTFALAQFAREQVKVVLGGDGGDELFAGYPTLQAHKAAGYLGVVPGFLKRGFHGAVSHLPVSQNNLSLDFKLKRFGAGLTLDLPDRHYVWLGAMPHQEALACLGPRALAGLRPGRVPYEPARFELLCSDELSELDRVLYLDYKLYLESDILVKVDRASMATSLEVRVPLLNNIVVDYVSHLPASLKLKGFTTKSLLKQAAKDLVPAEIINRPKKGFNMPVAKWFSGELRPLLLDTLAPAKLNAHGLLDPATVGSLLGDHFAHRRDNRKALWALFVFQQWHDRYAAAPQKARAATRTRHLEPVAAPLPSTAA